MMLSIEYWEMLSDAIDEVADWEAYEADLAKGDPWAE